MRLRRIAALGLALLMLFSCAAALVWPEQPTAGQLALMAWTERANDALRQQQAPPINSVLECYPGFAVLGVTAEDNADATENVEIEIILSESGPIRIDVRTNDLGAFPALAAACVTACEPASDAAAVRRAADEYVSRARKNPNNSFGDAIDSWQGDSLRIYYTYNAEQYVIGYDGDGRAVYDRWITLTLIPPRDGSGGAVVTPQPTREPDESNPYDGDPEYVGYNPEDEFTHLEVFVSPTPEPYIEP